MRAERHVLAFALRIGTKGGPYEILAVDEAFRISDELLFSLILLVAFFDGAFQDPGHGLRNNGVSLVNDGVTAAASFVPFCYAAPVAASAVTGCVGGDGRGGHDFMVRREGLKRLEDCSCHFERVIGICEET